MTIYYNSTPGRRRLSDYHHITHTMSTNTTNRPLQPILEAWKREQAIPRATMFQRFEAGWSAGWQACKAHIIEQIGGEVSLQLEPSICPNCAPAGRCEKRQALCEANVTAPAQSADNQQGLDRISFKNFHRQLCERFGYHHDEKDWERDQVSLIEWIAKQHVAANEGAQLHEDDHLSIDVQQVISALERAERALLRQADALANKGDYTAEFPSDDAKRMREAIQLLQDRSPSVVRLQHEVVDQARRLKNQAEVITQMQEERDSLRAQADALHQAGRALGLDAGTALTHVVPAIKNLQCSRDDAQGRADFWKKRSGQWEERARDVEAKLRVRRRVRKAGGSFEHTGTVVAEFNTTAGQPRLVLEFDAPVAGMLHICRPDQVQDLGPELEHIPY